MHIFKGLLDFRGSLEMVHPANIRKQGLNSDQNHMTIRHLLWSLIDFVPLGLKQTGNWLKTLLETCNKNKTIIGLIKKKKKVDMNQHNKLSWSFIQCPDLTQSIYEEALFKKDCVTLRKDWQFYKYIIPDTCPKGPEIIYHVTELEHRNKVTGYLVEMMIISGHPENTMVWMSGDKWSFGLGLSLLPTSRKQSWNRHA